jgi:TPP-dependent pyruvate/acetoin dehydrogenase alpha subunit
MDEADFLVPSYREHAALHVRGMPLERTLLYWMGNEAGTVPPEGVDIYPPSVPIATQIPHATGLAWAAKLQGDDRAVVCHFGDGATSEGDFHEGLNFAGVFDVPAVSSVTTTSGPSPSRGSARPPARRWRARRPPTASTASGSTGWTRWRSTG